MKNIGQYNQDLSVPRKKDIDSLETRVKTNEDNIAMAESDIEGLNTDVGTLKTDVSNVKTALSSKQDTIVGAASTIVEDNLAAGKVLVSDASGKVGASDLMTVREQFLALQSYIEDDVTIMSENTYNSLDLQAANEGIYIEATDATGDIMFQFFPAEGKAQFFYNGDTSSPLTLTGIKAGTNDTDAVNVSQLNKVKNSIPSSSDFVKTSGGMVTGQLYLLGGTGPLAVKNGSVTLNEGYSIGYGDGNYNFNQINGQFQLIKNKTSTEGVFIGTQTNKADDYVALQTVVNSATQPMSTHINVRSNGVIDLSHEDSSSGSYFVNDVRIQGVANGTANNEAVNWRQLKQYLPLAGGAMTGTLDMRSQKIINVADGTDDSDAATVRQAKAGSPKGPVMVMINNVTLGAAHEVIHNNLWDCTFLGTIYGTRYIDGVEVQIYPQSHIVSVGGSDYGDAGGFCAVQKSANSMEVVIKALCTSSAAPSSIQIPCLVW